MEEQNAQQQQAQQAQSQMEEKKLNATVMGQFAKAKLDMAKEKESYAKIQELNASAEHKSSQADLDMVRTMIELEDMDLQNFRNNLELAEYVKMSNKASQEQALTG